MFRLFLVCLFLAVSLGAHSQAPAVFGTVKVSDFQEKYKADHAAAVLYDRGYTRFQNDAQGMYIEYTRETRIHIHQKSGLDYADIVIPYYQDGFGKSETIQSIEAYTYIIDADKGMIDKRPLNPEDIFTEKMTDKIRLKKFVLPNVREGSIIEYRFVKKTPFLFNPPDWEFQNEIPTKVSTYEIHLTPFYEYTYLLQGATRFDGYKNWVSTDTDAFANVKYNFGIHRYTMKNIPAFDDESFITTKDDYIMKMDFQLSKVNYPSGGSKDIMTNWPTIIDDYLDRDNFGKYLKQIAKYTSKVYEENASLQLKEDQIKNIVEFVRTNYEWDGDPRDYTTTKAKEFSQSRVGSSAEINLFLCGLLRDAGFEAFPVILSTRNHGKVHTEYAFSHYFNDVITAIRINDTYQLLDGTEMALPFDRLPVRCLNEVGLVIEKDQVHWISLESNNESISNYYLDIKLNVDALGADVTVANRSTGYAGFLARKRVGDAEDKLEDSNISGDLANIEEVTFKNVDQPDRAYMVNFKGDRPIEGYGDKLLINPFKGYVDEESPFKATTRKYPVDMIYPRTTQITAVLEIPEGYSPLEIPEEFVVDNPMIQSSLKVQVKDGSIQLVANVAFKSAVYQAKDYKKLRSDYAFVLNKLNQLVVLHQAP